MGKSPLLLRSAAAFVLTKMEINQPAGVFPSRRHRLHRRADILTNSRSVKSELLPAKQQDTSRQVFLSDLYRCLTGAVPSGSNLATWMATSSSNSLVSIYSSIFGAANYYSSEFTNSQFVNHAYQCVLERNAEPEGYTSWLNRLNGGMTRQTLVTDFVNSFEFKQNISPSVASSTGWWLRQYYGQDGSVMLGHLGWNAADNTPLPGSTSLFLGRDLFKPDGTPLTPADGWIKAPATEEAHKHHRWGVVLSQVDWTHHQFNLIKPLIVTPLNITAGPFAGSTLKAAYDPDIVLYNGKNIVSFECVFLGNPHGFDGTSSCIAVYNPKTQTIDPSTIHAVVSGRGEIAYGAGVPHLLVWKNRLFMYYSTVDYTPHTLDFSHIAIRGVELAPDANGVYWVKSTNKVIYAKDPQTVEVWGTASSDPTRNTSVDLKSVWQRDGEIFMAASLGGGGCVMPGGRQPGCWRLSIASSSAPLRADIFNNSSAVNPEFLPTNPQDYTRPIRNSSGQCMLLGDFVKPWPNGFSELRPVPPAWNATSGTPTLVTFPFEEDLCPRASS